MKKSYLEELAQTISLSNFDSSKYFDIDKRKEILKNQTKYISTAKWGVLTRNKGSGILISPNIILTSNTLINDGHPAFSNDKRAIVLTRDETLDLALCIISSDEKYSQIYFANNISLQESVEVYGRTFDTFTSEKGIVAKETFQKKIPKKYFKDSPDLYDQFKLLGSQSLATYKVNTNFIGGPIFNENGELLGIHKESNPAGYDLTNSKLQELLGNTVVSKFIRIDYIKEFIVDYLKRKKIDI